MIRIFNFLERFPFFLPSCSYSCSPLLPTLRTHTFHAMTLNFPREEAFENFFIMKKSRKLSNDDGYVLFMCALNTFFFASIRSFIGEETENVVISRLLFFCLRNRLWISKKLYILLFYGMMVRFYAIFWVKEKLLRLYYSDWFFSLTHSFARCAWSMIRNTKVLSRLDLCVLMKILLP